MSTPQDIIPRSSYSYNNASRWIRFFDIAIESRRDVKILWKKENNMAVSTMKNRIADGLKWLADHDIADFDPKAQYKQEDYRGLRNNVTVITLPDEGVLISFRMGRRARPTSNFDYSPIDREVVDKWKEDLVTYMQNENDQGVFFRDNLALSPADIEWALQLTKGCEAKINATKITVVK